MRTFLAALTCWTTLLLTLTTALAHPHPDLLKREPTDLNISASFDDQIASRVATLRSIGFNLQILSITYEDPTNAPSVRADAFSRLTIKGIDAARKQMISTANASDKPSGWSVPTITSLSAAQTISLAADAWDWDPAGSGGQHPALPFARAFETLCQRLPIPVLKVVLRCYGAAKPGFKPQGQEYYRFYFDKAGREGMYVGAIDGQVYSPSGDNAAVETTGSQGVGAIESGVPTA